MYHIYICAIAICMHNFYIRLHMGSMKIGTRVKESHAVYNKISEMVKRYGSEQMKS